MDTIKFNINPREVLVLMFVLGEDGVPEVAFAYSFAPEVKWPESLDERLKIELSE